MHAMILAAGRGERMRPLTDSCPKPLLRVGGKALIEWHLRHLARCGINQIVINHSHLGKMLEQALGDGSGHDVRIKWSPEAKALETAGGIAQALPMLASDPFLVVNGDIWCDFDFRRCTTIAAQMIAGQLDCWCVMVENPPHHPNGDFGIDNGRLLDDSPNRLTFSGIGVYRRRLFARLEPGRPAALAPVLREAISRGAAGAERHAGRWFDVGTPQRLTELDAQLRLEG